MADGNAPMLGSSGLDKYANLPGNSQKTKAEMEFEQKTKKDISEIRKSNVSRTSDEPDKHEVKKIVTGVRKKKPLGTRFKETFLSEESDTVGSYVLWDILIPAAKETISDLVTGAINILLFGDAGSRSGRRGNRGNRIVGGYKDYSTSSRISNRDSDERRYGRRARRSFDDIIIPDRQTALQVLDDMKDLIADYGQCSIADYYDMVDQSWEPTDKYWGWKDLAGVKPRPVHGGCILDLPDIEQL